MNAGASGIPSTNDALPHHAKSQPCAPRHQCPTSQPDRSCLETLRVSLPLLVLIPFLGAALVAWAGGHGRLRSAYATGLVTFSALMLLLPSVGDVLQGATLYWRHDWLPAAGLAVSFRLDGLGLLFALMILVIGLLVILYARYYLAESDPMGRFFAYLLLFQGSMLGVVLSENIIQLLIFWELTSISSFLLISYWRQREDAREGARMALAITGAGGLAMLAGFLLLGEIAGSYELSVILRSGDVDPRTPLVRSHPGADPVGGVHQVGAVSVPFLATACDGRADAGQRVSALRDNGQGRCLYAGPPVPGPILFGRVVLVGWRRRLDHAAARRLHGAVQARP